MNFSALRTLATRNWMWIGIALLAIVFIWDWIAIRRSLWRGKAKSPSCGQCGYSVTGLERMICPECGGDLRQVGIVDRPEYRRRIVNRVIVLVIFTAALIVAARLTMRGMYELWPLNYSYISRADLSKPASRAYLGLKVEASVSSYSRRTTTLPVQITMYLPSGNSVGSHAPSFHAFTDDHAYQFTDLAGNSTTINEPFSDQAVLKWFAACGIAANDPKVALEVKRIANICLAPARMSPAVPSYATGRTSDEVFGSNYWQQISGKRALPLGGPFIYSIWAVLWVFGMIQIIGTDRFRRLVAPLAGRFRRGGALALDHQL